MGTEMKEITFSTWTGRRRERFRYNCTKSLAKWGQNPNKILAIPSHLRWAQSTSRVLPPRPTHSPLPVLSQTRGITMFGRFSGPLTFLAPKPLLNWVLSIILSHPYYHPSMWYNHSFWLLYRNWLRNMKIFNSLSHTITGFYMLKKSVSRRQMGQWPSTESW
jgi:hypothetical protein